MVSRSQIQVALVKALIDMQTINGKSIPVIDESTHPIGDLEGFDSLSALEISFSLSVLLGIDIEPKIELFAKNGRTHSVGEIVEHIYQQLNL